MAHCTCDKAQSEFERAIQNGNFERAQELYKSGKVVYYSDIEQTHTYISRMEQAPMKRGSNLGARRAFAWISWAPRAASRSQAMATAYAYFMRRFSKYTKIEGRWVGLPGAERC